MSVKLPIELKFILPLILLFFPGFFNLSAQTHVSVPLESPVYYVLEQAEIRGLTGPLPAVRPYSQRFIVETIEKILDAPSNRLSNNERVILERELQRYRLRTEAQGLDWKNGSYSFISQLPGSHLFSVDLGIGAQIALAGARYNDETGTSIGMDNMGLVYTRGDVGENFSFDFNFYAAMVRAPRKYLGEYNNFFDIVPDEEVKEDVRNRKIQVYSEPLTAFPYSFKRNWDPGYFLSAGDLSDSGFIEWPDKLGIGPMVMSELSGAMLGNSISWRFGRMRREWGAMTRGQSLALNSAAQPFVALEASFHPVPWFGFSAMTGAMEYVPTGGDQRLSAWSSQTLFSIEQLELNYKNYVHFGFGTTTIWAKRFELGYIFPLIPNFLYQAHVGDFDNSALFMNLMGQLPGRGRVWASLFLDDMVPSTAFEGIFKELDWNQFAYQFGAKALIPWFGSFTNLMFSYTKNEPYNYTHRRVLAPWHSSQFNDDHTLPLEVGYLNQRASLGHYIPPNSDEFLIRLETMPAVNSLLHLQFQLVRHGATHGNRAVDGSHLLSELYPHDRKELPELRKFFLRDGAYKWTYVVKAGGEFALPQNFFGDHTLTGYFISTFPIKVFFEAGVIFSHYTDIDENIMPNSGFASPYSRIDTPDYPRVTGFLATFGVRFFPR